MFECCYFVLGVLNNLLLISVFLTVRFFKMMKMKYLAITYLLLGFPAAALIIASVSLNKPVQYSIFLGIFIAFLLLEGLYEYILKMQFRKNWKLLIPYLALYWSMNYGFIVMTWKTSAVQGGIMLGLFVLQLTANILSHTKRKDSKTG